MNIFIYLKSRSVHHFGNRLIGGCVCETSIFHQMVNILQVGSEDDKVYFLIKIVRIISGLMILDSLDFESVQFQKTENIYSWKRKWD